ncbi:MAG: hypothetical protein [Bacteriophage sp.]|nr:MAG: hypothetical protein [Bacteriophage sp.]
MLLSVEIILKIGQAIVPLVKEYMLSPEQRKWAKKNFVLMLTALCLLCFMIENAYLREQAENNMGLHDKLLAQNREMVDKNRYLAGQVQSLQNDVIDSEAHSKYLAAECRSSAPNVASTKNAIAYHPTTKTIEAE